MRQGAMTMLAEPSKTSLNESNRYTALICAVLAVGIFILDVQSLPLGVAAGVAYVGVVFIALWLPERKHTFIVAGGVSLLTILGFILSEPAGVPWMVVVNRLLALYAIWLTAIAGTWLVLTKRRRSEADLQEIEREVDRARNAKSRFLNTASNDMRHHLQTLNLLNGALRKTVTQPKAQEMFAMQGDALAELSDLLNSLLEISEFEAGEVELNITETPIRDVFQKLKDEFEYQAQAKHLQIEFESQSEAVLSDGFLLIRILRVLVSNAIRYTNEGEVRVSCRHESAGLRITVQDTGVGMAADQLALIFEEFYRINNDPVARNNGLGLGLSIAECSANLLGTTVNVESELGRGSSFSLLVPAAA